MKYLPKVRALKNELKSKLKTQTLIKIPPHAKSP